MKVFIDGRADMYGDRFTLDFDRMSDGDVQLFQRTADRYAIEWVILWKADALSAKLDKVPGWRRIHSDEIATVHVRERRQSQPR